MRTTGAVLAGVVLHLSCVLAWSPMPRQHFFAPRSRQALERHVLLCNVKTCEQPAGQMHEILTEANVTDHAPVVDVNSTQASEDINALQQEQAELDKQIKELDNKLRAVRLAVVEMDEDLKRTGKTGYYRLVAEAENLRRRRKEEMASLEVEVKRTMVEKFLGILDGLVTIPTKFPATTDKERNIYSNFHVLSDQARGQFESLGMVYVTPALNSTFDPVAHEVAETVEADTNDIILEVKLPGVMVDSFVIRKAKVVVTRKSVISAIVADKNEDPRAEAAEIFDLAESTGGVEEADGASADMGQ